MRAYLGLVLGNRHQNLCHSVSDVILYDILHKKHRHEHADARIEEIKEVICFAIEP